MLLSNGELPKVYVIFFSSSGALRPYKPFFVQSIGFTANLPPPEEENGASGFMPFFTPNRRTTHNPMDLVEPIGKLRVTSLDGLSHQIRGQI
jgi:hypothetical protein